MIQVNAISNQTYCFIFDKDIAESDFNFTEPQQAVHSPLGKKLFGFPWTEAVKIGKNSVELTKKDWVDWDILLEPLTGLLEEHVNSTSTLEKPVIAAGTELGTAEAQQLKEFITNSINPSLAMHGGFIELKSFENKTAYLQMGGGCQGCASSQATMMDGVENALKNEFVFVERVVDVTDHASGANPYY